VNLPSFTFRRSDSTYFLIGIFAVLACVLFYFLGFLFIQTILLVAYVSLFPAMLIWEKRKKDRTSVDSSRLSEDQKWSKTKAKLEKLEQKIEKEKDDTKKQALILEKRSLESELRQLTWEIRESEMTQMYNASKGKMRQIDEPQSVISSMTELDAQFKKVQANKDYLLKTLKEAEDLTNKESQSSRDIALARLANDLKAQYNALKRKTNSSSDSKGNSEPIRTLLSDYWVCWAAVNSLAKGSTVGKDLTKYASKDFQVEFSKFIKSVNTRSFSI
jgi:hypothetical protein